MKVTMKEAEKLVPVSRTTLYNDKKAGTFSVEKNAKGRTVIDTSELQRVYGELNLTSEQSNNVQVNSKSTKQDNIKNSSNKNSSDVSVELEVLKERIKHLEEIKIERQKDKEQFEERIEKMQSTLDKALENQNKTTLLLEHYTKEDGQGDDWKLKLTQMESLLANQEKEAKEKAEEEAKQKELLLSEKKDLSKANKVYAGLAVIALISVLIIGVVQAGIIKISF